MATFGLTDQADSLRRMFGGASPYVVTLASGGSSSEQSLFLANFATALTQLGRRVTILDEEMQNPIAKVFGKKVRYDLLHAVMGEMPASEVTCDLLPNLRLLPAAQFVSALLSLSTEGQDRLARILATQQEAACDFLLINNSAGHALGFSPFGLASHDVIISLQTSKQAITEAYALMKKIALAYAHRRFHIVVDQAKDQKAAVSIYDNLARLSENQFRADLENVGFIPKDAAFLQAAKLAQPVCALFPESLSGRAYNELAQKWCEKVHSCENLGTLPILIERLLQFSRAMNPVAIYA